TMLENTIHPFFGGEMLLFGASSIHRQIILFIGTDDQQFLSYNPDQTSCPHFVIIFELVCFVKYSMIDKTYQMRYTDNKAFVRNKSVLRYFYETAK
ncbi:MAG: hypothetical protein IJI30_06685, partial [Lachnospiraceae bacterium]|nr:hypothetical protein [Lachnospiraceae bacterium]